MPFRYSILMLALSSLLFSKSIVAAEPSSVKKLATVEVKSTAINDTPQLKQKQISEREIDLQQANNLSDVVRMVPGINLTDIGRFGSSGFNIRGVEGDRVKITVDGLSLGETMDPDSHAPYEFFRSGLGGIDPDALKQVTILKGADAISAGSGALGGAVLFQTKNAADYLNSEGDDGAVKLKTQYSGNNSEFLNSMTLASRTGQLESLLVFSKRNGNEVSSFDESSSLIGPSRTSADPLTASSQNLLLKLQYNIFPNHRVGYTLDNYKTDSILENLSRQDQTYINRTGLDDSERDKHSFQYEFLSGNFMFDTFELRLDHQNSRNHGLTRMKVSAPCPQNITPCLREEDRDFRQKLTQLTASFDKEIITDGLQQLFTYGVQTQNKIVNASAVDRRYVGATKTLATLEVDPAFVPLTDIQNRSIYVRDAISWDKSALSAVFGVRYDQIDYTPTISATFQDKTGTVKPINFGSSSYQAQFRYELAPRSNLSFQIGRGFRAPTTEDLYFQTSTTTLIEVATGATVILPTAASNPNLKPEHSLNLELSYQLTLANSTHQLSVFKDKYTDMIATSQFTANPTTIYQSCSRGVCTNQNGAVYSMATNIDSAIVKGVELEGSWMPDEYWRLNWAATYQSGDEETGEPLISVMPLSAVFGVGYQVQQDLRLMLNNRYQMAKKSSDAWTYSSEGTKVAATPFLSDSALVSDLAMQWQFHKNLSLTAGVFNLLDTEYYRWERLRYVTESVGAVRGGVTQDGIRRYLETGRYGKFSLTMSF